MLPTFSSTHYQLYKTYQIELDKITNAETTPASKTSAKKALYEQTYSKFIIASLQKREDLSMDALGMTNIQMKVAAYAGNLSYLDLQMVPFNKFINSLRMSFSKYDCFVRKMLSEQAQAKITPPSSEGSISSVMTLFEKEGLDLTTSTLDEISKTLEEPSPSINDVKITIKVIQDAFSEKETQIDPPILSEDRYEEEFKIWLSSLPYVENFEVSFILEKGNIIPALRILKIKKLYIIYCFHFNQIAELEAHKLETLCIRSSNLKNLRGLEKITSLKKLSIERCNISEGLPDLRALINVVDLDFTYLECLPEHLQIESKDPEVIRNTFQLIAEHFGHVQGLHQEAADLAHLLFRDEPLLRQEPAQ